MRFYCFTGTPLLKSDKETSIEISDVYHTYKFDEAVADKVVLDLLYGQEHRPIHHLSK